MNSFEWQKLKEVVLYILNATEGLDYYRVFKVLYFAERYSLTRFGSRIVADDFRALPHGSVPSDLYNAIKAMKGQMGEILSDVIDLAGDDASNTLLAKRLYDPDYLSRNDILCLDASIKENSRLSFNELKKKSHDSAWQKVAHCGTISSVDMAIAGEASESIVEYIREQAQIDVALS